jgi:hypothetical protein
VKPNEWPVDLPGHSHRSVCPQLNRVLWDFVDTDLDPPPDHSRITHSRHQTVPLGHVRTRRPRELSSKGPLRSRQDTRGHATKTVRDREAPGSNPGPPTKIELKIGRIAARPATAGHSRVTDFLGTRPAVSPIRWLLSPDLNSCVTKLMPTQVPHLGLFGRTVRHLVRKPKLSTLMKPRRFRLLPRQDASYRRDEFACPTVHFWLSSASHLKFGQ